MTTPDRALDRLQPDRTATSLATLEIDVPDPWRDGLARGWQVTNATTLDRDLVLEADVVIVGTGAGGGTSAELLAEAGLSVVMVEEGMLKTSDAFTMREGEAYRDLYQEGALRATTDGAISVLQGRSVGGTTTVNWTASFRTPDQTLDHWTRRFGVRGITPGEMAPWFERAEARLGITPWPMAPNAHNDLLRRGCESLGWHWAVIPRNVRGCWNIGYCGMGCPTNAKQSMLVTTIPAALDRGARLVWRLRAERVLVEGTRAVGVACVALSADGQRPTGRRVTVRARHVVLAGGGINTPGLMLRSALPDPHRRIGRRTCLHVTTSVFAQVADPVEAYYGAPQSVYSDQFQWESVADGPMGFKLEVAPLHPAFTAALMGVHGARHAGDMARLPYTSAVLALLRDGFHEESPGGTVSIRDDGAPVLDYPVTRHLLAGARRAHRAMLELQFAAGAVRARPMLSDAAWHTALPSALAAVDRFDYRPHHVRLGSAHVMGGCAMGEDVREAVCDSRGRVHHVEGLSVFDGSLFPTSIGANPQLSIYGLVTKLTTELIAELGQGAPRITVPRDRAVAPRG
jgi:choline dehydrogenase-like flavoprotein